MRTTNIGEKARMLILLARTTNEPALRRRCCVEAKTLIDMMDPVIEYEDPVHKYITTNYDLTYDHKDQLPKLDVIRDYRESTGDYLTSKKAITASIINLGLVVDPRGCAEGRSGIYTIVGLRRKNET